MVVNTRNVRGGEHEGPTSIKQGSAADEVVDSEGQEFILPHTGRY